MFDSKKYREKRLNEVITKTIDGVERTMTVREFLEYLESRRMINTPSTLLASQQLHKRELQDNITSFWNDGLTPHEKLQVEQFTPTSQTKIPVLVNAIGTGSDRLYMYKLDSFPKKFGVDTRTILAAHLAKYQIYTMGSWLHIRRGDQDYYIGDIIRNKKVKPKNTTNRFSKKFFK